MVTAIVNKHTIIAALRAYNVSSWSRVNFRTDFKARRTKNETQNCLLAGTQSAAPAFTKKTIAWLNHYSITEFTVKRERGLQNRRTKNIDLSYWAE